MGLQQAGLKWPNDLHVAGRKLSGILVEIRTPPSVDASGAVDVVIGTGINVQLTEAEIAAVNQPVTSLAKCGLEVERSELIVRLAQTTRQFLDHFVASGFAPFVEAFNQVHVLHNQLCTIHLANGDVLGKVQGISDTGNLLVEDSSGNLVQYAAGEVSLRPANSPTR